MQAMTEAVELTTPFRHLENAPKLCVLSAMPLKDTVTCLSSHTYLQKIKIPISNTSRMSFEEGTIAEETEQLLLVYINFNIHFN